MTNVLIEQLDDGTRIYKFVDGEQGANVYMTVAGREYGYQYGHGEG